MSTAVLPQAATEPARDATSPKRLVSLDVFRGATIASMMLVNNPGSEANVYSPLEHAEWHGWTFTDTVFPFFMWIVGVAMTLSFAKRIERGDDKWKLFVHTLRRAVTLFAVGLLLNAFPFFRLETWRIPGVLQRIAIGYFIAGTIFLLTKVRGQILFTGFFLIAYWMLMTLVPVPGVGPGHLEKDANLARYVDSLFLSGHMWSHTKVWDPEGVLSTLPAIATTLFGVLMGHLLRLNRAAAERTVYMFMMGNSLICLGLLMNVWMPINKNLWTSTFSVFMAGLASIVFAFWYWIVDVQGWRKWVRPLAIYGMNAIAMFIAAGLIGRLLNIIHVGKLSLQATIFQNVFLPLASPVNASLLYAIAIVVFFYAIAYGMYRRGWFLRL